jgi:hypothetical protein
MPGGWESGWGARAGACIYTTTTATTTTATTTMVTTTNAAPGILPPLPGICYLFSHPRTSAAAQAAAVAGEVHHGRVEGRPQLGEGGEEGDSGSGAGGQLPVWAGTEMNCP